ncbi:MAG: RagB/SusD family nutrient uptake outer membrane protein [Dysgonamonadaceae bacterium]|jgi:hypothetical protein|nr:RagB/SusD family nutrient uptake outer membrane protein [Dysgonamonadaceae bacterium]
MKKNIIKTTLILPVFFIWGCNSYLDPDMDNAYMKDDMLKRAKYAEGILLNAYNSLPNNLILNDVASDDAVSNQVSDNIVDFRRAANGEWSSFYNPFSQWDSYSAIAYLNLFLDEFADQTVWSPTNTWLQENFRRRLKGEAHGLRAYYYSRLLQSHAGIGALSGTLLGVPMALVSNSSTLHRASFDECINMILTDIKIAVDSLPDLYAAAPVGDPEKANKDAVYGPNFKNRMCGRIAKMIKARVLLQAASPAFNPTDDASKWAAAADAAAEVIDAAGGVSALSPTRLDYYLSTDNSDHLWRRDATNISGWEKNNFPPSLNGNGNTNPSQNLIDAFPSLNGYPIDNLISGHIKATPYINRDPRLAKWIICNGTIFKDVTINSIDDPLDGIGKIAERSTRSGYYLLKFMNPNVSVISGSVIPQLHTVNLMRYTEAYLIYAEAANRAWGPDGKGNHAYSARDIIARLRVTAGITGNDPYLASLTNKDDFETLIRNERRLEMCFENVRFWDIRRWKDLAAMKTEVKGTATGGISSFVVERRPFADYMIYGPIPVTEVLKGLEQNQGW